MPLSSTIVIETPDNHSDKFAAMMTGEEIRAERDRLKMSQAELGKAIGISQVAIAKIETGKTTKSKYIIDIMQYFKKHSGGDQGGLLFSPAAQNAPKIPVYACAEGGPGVLIVSNDVIEYVTRPYTLEGIPDAYAILVTGDSMAPAYEPGDYAWVNPRLPPMRDADCLLYSVDDRTGEARASIKRLVSWTDKTWTVLQFNPRKQFTLERAQWNRHHRVVGNFRRR